MSAQIFYNNITLLNRDAHKNLKLQRRSDFAFARKTHLVPLALQEFHQAARDYPILFVGEGEAQTPVALLGLKPETNSFVDEQGGWITGTYVPAFVRRYPFVLADTENDNFSVCFDADYDGWSEEEGEPLFDEEGKNTNYLQEVIQFLQSFTVEMRRTQAFVDRMKELKLMEKKRLDLRHPSGEQFSINDFYGIDEKAFLELDDADILALHKEGFLGAIYAHLISLGSSNSLFDRHIKLQAETQKHPEPEPELH